MNEVMLVLRLQHWTGNSAKRLVRSPKVYVRDTGVLHSLRGIASLDALLAHPVPGSSREGMVIEHLIVAMPEGAEASFYRTSAGAEIDLVGHIDGAAPTQAYFCPPPWRAYQAAKMATTR